MKDMAIEHNLLHINFYVDDSDIGYVVSGRCSSYSIILFYLSLKSGAFSFLGANLPTVSLSLL